MTPLVLLIEDDADQRKILSAMLESRYEVRESWNLATGIRSANEHRPDIVLLDLNLRDSRGINTLDFFIRMVPDPPVIVVSGIITDLGEECIRHGAADVVVKPFTQTELLGTIVRSLARKRISQYRTPIDESMARINETLKASETLSDSKIVHPPVVK